MRALSPVVALVVAFAAPAAVPRARAQVAAPAADAVTYKNGFALRTPDDAFALRIVGRLQPRYELFKDLTDGATGPEVNRHRFQVARGRVTLEGHAHETVGYKFQAEFGKGFVFLRDYYLDPKLGPVHLRFGQWKKPYSRQQITSSGNLQLVDRSITDRFSGAGRDIGVMLHGQYEKSADGLEWALGVFNGTGDRPEIACEADDGGAIECEQTNVPGDVGPQLAARIGWNHGGIKGYSESDLEGGPLRLAVAVGYLNDLKEGETDRMEQRIGPDLMVKVAGFSLTGAAYLVKLGEADADLGFHGQAGYFLIPKRIEVAGRFAQVPRDDEDQREILGGFNWFFAGHALKWQTDVGYLTTTGAPDREELVVRTQAQLVF